MDEHDSHYVIQYPTEESEIDEESDDWEGRRFRDFRFKKGKFKSGFYELSCSSCEQSWRAATAAKLRPFAPFELTTKQIARFEKNVLELFDDDICRVDGFPFDEIGHVADFLDQHGKHQLTARLQTARASKG